MARKLRVAVEPHFRAFHAASACRLIDKALRHQGDLIEENASQRNALDQILRPLVLAAEDVEVILPAALGDDDQILGALVIGFIASALQHQAKPEKHIPAKTADGFAAHGEVLAVEICHRPESERQGHAQSLAASDRAVADNTVRFVYRGFFRPPVQHLPLLLREWSERKHGVIHHRQPNPVPPFRSEPQGIRRSARRPAGSLRACRAISPAFDFSARKSVPLLAARYRLLLLRIL